MKILFYIQTMEGGGAARLLSLIANELVERDHEIIIANNLNFKISYHLSDRIKLLPLYKEDSYSKSRIARFFSQLSNARKIAKEQRPDVIITMLPPVSFYTYLATIGLHIPIVFCDVTSYARKDSPFVHFVRYHFYKLADAVTVQTENDRKILGNRIPQKVVINNPLSYPIYEGENERSKTILSIGATSEWNIKGLDILIRAFGMVAHRHPGWNVEIAGKKEPKTLEYLMGLIQENKLEGRVSFVGFLSDIEKKMREVSIFALPSRIEGFSLSLTEALSQGCPAVAFKIQGVITDVTDNGHGTLLTEDYDERQFADNLDKLMINEGLRKQLAEEGKLFVKKYDIATIGNHWEALIRKITQ